MSVSGEQNPLSNLAVIVPVWNEEFLLPAKLKDLQRIDPGMVIFTEGCFDDNFPASSTDNSRGLIESFRKKSATKVVILDAQRLSKFRNVSKLYSVGSSLRYHPMFLERLVGLRTTVYRSNQASTLNLACSLAKENGMTHVFINDVDEFLSNAALAQIRAEGLQEKSMIFSEVTTYGYPPRLLEKYYSGVLKTWNGIYPLSSKFFLIPTREPRFFKSATRGSQSVEKSGFIEYESIFHLKNLEPEREALSYKVGKRRQPKPVQIESSTLPDMHREEIEGILNGIFSE